MFITSRDNPIFKRLRKLAESARARREARSHRGPGVCRRVAELPPLHGRGDRREHEDEAGPAPGRRGEPGEVHRGRGVVASLLVQVCELEVRGEVTRRRHGRAAPDRSGSRGGARRREERDDAVLELRLDREPARVRGHRRGQGLGEGPPLERALVPARHHRTISVGVHVVLRREDHDGGRGRRRDREGARRERERDLERAAAEGGLHPARAEMRAQRLLGERAGHGRVPEEPDAGLGGERCEALLDELPRDARRDAPRPLGPPGDEVPRDEDEQREQRRPGPEPARTQRLRTENR